jgi:transglutaminase-like putative cysteine protease
MKKIFLYLCLCLYAVSAYGEKGEYDIKKIPAGLRNESNVVVRKHIDEFQVIDERRAIRYYTKAYTIFSKDEQHLGNFYLTYNSSFWDVDYIEGHIYDASGKEIKELSKKDIKDYSNYFGYSLYSDYRIKEASLHHTSFPYTVEFSYRITYDGYLDWPEWYSRRNEAPVQLSRFVVKIPADEELRFWCNSDTLKPVIKTDGRYRIYSWEAVNLPELQADAISVSNTMDYSDFVTIAPGDFIMDGYRGSMKSWRDFGAWYYKLASTQGDLPKEAVAEIKNQYNENDDVIEKIKKLYRYMQSKTRYVSISLGIGGWQPFKASFVHEKGYGDCKALSNYMQSILKAAGIASCQALIYSGDDSKMIEEFPSNQFNHVILCVPMPLDTVWLECTSQTDPYNNVGWHIQKRMALLIQPEGGRMIYTPASVPDQNIQVRKSEVNFQKNGSATVDMMVIWTGGQRDYNYNYIATAPGSQKAERIIASMSVPDIKLKEFIFEDEKSFSSNLTLNIKAELPRYATVSGNRLFFKPNLAEQRTRIPKDVKRISPYNFRYPFADADTLIYNIPAGYIVEALPPEINLENTFGKYKAKCEIDGDRIIYTRYYEISDYNIPASVYNEYRKFISDIVKADRTQIVLAMKK